MKRLPPSASFGEHLRAQRLTLGLTLRNVANLVGVSFPFIHDIEMGRRSLAVARYPEVAKALQVPLATLLRWSDACLRCKGTGKR
jgi:transcriptional regulator with XRE-family HTH domain